MPKKRAWTSSRRRVIVAKGPLRGSSSAARSATERPSGRKKWYRGTRIRFASSGRHTSAAAPRHVSLTHHATMADT